MAFLLFKGLHFSDRWHHGGKDDCSSVDRSECVTLTRMTGNLVPRVALLTWQEEWVVTLTWMYSKSCPQSGNADTTKPLRAGPSGSIAHRRHACSSQGTLVWLAQAALENKQEAWPLSVSLVALPPHDLSLWHTSPLISQQVGARKLWPEERSRRCQVSKYLKYKLLINSLLKDWVFCYSNRK